MNISFAFELTHIATETYASLIELSENTNRPPKDVINTFFKCFTAALEKQEEHHV